MSCYQINIILVVSFFWLFNVTICYKIYGYSVRVLSLGSWEVLPNHKSYEEDWVFVMACSENVNIFFSCF